MAGNLCTTMHRGRAIRTRGGVGSVVQVVLGATAVAVAHGVAARGEAEASVALVGAAVSAVGVAEAGAGSREPNEIRFLGGCFANSRQLQVAGCGTLGGVADGGAGSREPNEIRFLGGCFANSRQLQVAGGRALGGGAAVHKARWSRNASSTSLISSICTVPTRSSNRSTETDRTCST